MDDHAYKAKTPTCEIEEIEDEVAIRFKLFKIFDEVSYPPPDHHFLGSKPPITQPDSNSSFAARIFQEREMLETTLPDSICVRAYKRRIDLMRAVIVGPPDVPYSYGLFFFDILFPGTYPAQPPKLFYRSCGLDLNPNLNSNGKVCLPLLNTSHGYKEEKWNPKQTTILEVLISIQKLVSNNKPCVNEPRCFRYQKELPKPNKEVFMLVCEAMLYTINMPPMHFEDFVAGHFRRRAHPILMNGRAFINSSEAMNRLFLSLVKAFEDNGSYCKHHVCLVKTKEEPPEQKSDDNGVGMKILNKMKTILEF